MVEGLLTVAIAKRRQEKAPAVPVPGSRHRGKASGGVANACTRANAYGVAQKRASRGQEDGAYGAELAGRKPRMRMRMSGP